MRLQMQTAADQGSAKRAKVVGGNLSIYNNTVSRVDKLRFGSRRVEAKMQRSDSHMQYRIQMQ